MLIYGNTRYVVICLLMFIKHGAIISDTFNSFSAYNLIAQYAHFTAITEV